MALELHISVLDGDTVKETLVLSSGVHRTAKIGRMPSAAIRLEDPSVARIHAVIEIGAQEATLVDMGTTAGTLLGDERVQRAVLKHGDKIGLGETLLLVGIGEPAALHPEPEEPVIEPIAEVAQALTPVSVQGEEAPELFTEFNVPPEYQVVEIHDADDVAPELSFDKSHALLELRRFVEGDLVSVEHLHPNTALLLGESKRAQVFVGEDILPAPNFALVRYAGGNAEIQWGEGFSGRIVHQNQDQSLEQWASSDQTTPVPGLDSCHRLGFELESKARIEVGGWGLELSFVAAVKKPPLGIFRAFDFVFANLTLFSLLLHLLIGMYLYRLPAPDKALDGAFFEEPDRFASLLLKPPKVEEDTPDDKDLKKVKRKKDLQEVEKELVVADQEAPVDEEDARNKRKDELKEQFSALFDDGNKGGTDALLGEAAGIGGTLEGGLVAVIGTRGASSSDTAMPTVGLSSSMIPGGKLRAAAAAAPKVDTMGRMGGGKANYGADVKLDKRKDRKAVSLSTPTIMGSLAREVVERVIRENINQIRYCYEVELQRRQNLAGRVVASWVISASGRVVRVKITDSTLASKRTEKCIMRRIKTWQFPRPAGGGVVTVNYPFVFRSG